MTKRWRPGSTSRKSPIRLSARSVASSDNPVTLPPGRAKLATKPPPTGSLASANTIGMTAVACFVARTALPDVTMTFTLRRTNSAQSQRSVRCVLPPSDTRTRRCALLSSQVRAAAAQKRRHIGSRPKAWRRLKTPIVGGLPGCCALAASGHAAAPPSTDMNCRLPTPTIICPVPTGITPAVMWGRISRTNRPVWSSRRLLRCRDPVVIGGKAEVPSLAQNDAIDPSRHFQRMTCCGAQTSFSLLHAGQSCLKILARCMYYLR